MKNTNILHSSIIASFFALSVWQGRSKAIPFFYPVGLPSHFTPRLLILRRAFHRIRTDDFCLLSFGKTLSPILESIQLHSAAVSHLDLWPEISESANLLSLDHIDLITAASQAFKRKINSMRLISSLLCQR